jgi:hypothetical protein
MIKRDDNIFCWLSAKFVLKPHIFFVFPFQSYFWPQEISILVLEGFARAKKFLDCRKFILLDSRNFFREINPFFLLQDIS